MDYALEKFMEIIHEHSERIGRMEATLGRTLRALAKKVESAK